MVVIKDTRDIRHLMHMFEITEIGYMVFIIPDDSLTELTVHNVRKFFYLFCFNESTAEILTMDY